MRTAKMVQAVLGGLVAKLTRCPRDFSGKCVESIYYRPEFYRLAEYVRKVLNRSVCSDAALLEEDDNLILQIRNTRFIIDTEYELIEAIDTIEQLSHSQRSLIERGVRQFVAAVMTRYRLSLDVLLTLLGWSHEQLKEVMTKNTILWKEFKRLLDVELLDLLLSKEGMELRFNGRHIEIIHKNAKVGVLYNVESLLDYLKVETKPLPPLWLTKEPVYAAELIAERECSDPEVFRLLIRSVVERLDLLNVSMAAVTVLTGMSPADLLNYLYVDPRAVTREQLVGLLKIYLIAERLKQKYSNLVIYTVRLRDTDTEQVVVEGDGTVLVSTTKLGEIEPMVS